VVADHNLTIRNPARLFVDPDDYNFHLKKRSRAVNTGSPKSAPHIDIEKVPRPWGSAYDVGAYEYHEGDIEREPPPTVAPPDATAKDDVEDEYVAHDGLPIVDVGTPSRSPAEAEPELGSGAAIPKQDEGFGDLPSWGVILLAATFLFVAWRIGR